MWIGYRACGVCAIIPGPRTFRDLINCYGGARAALAALPGLAQRGGASGPARIGTRDEAMRELKASQPRGIAFIALGEPDYPQRLQMIDDAPPLIAVRGKQEILARPLVAIVGSRNASAAGVKFAERLARDLGDAGFGIVSGLARGIDAAAHRRLAAGTIAVLAGGHDRIYPAEHADCSTPSRRRRRHFGNAARLGAARARFSASQSADLRPVARRGHRRGGAPLRLADHRALAGEQGREVFAVPGSPLDPRAEGTNGLIKLGATMVTEAADVIAVLEPILGRGIEPSPALEPEFDIPTCRITNRARTSAAASSACSGRPPRRSTTWCGCRIPRRRSCARCFWNSKSPAAWSATAAPLFR